MLPNEQLTGAAEPHSVERLVRQFSSWSLGHRDTCPKVNRLEVLRKSIPRASCTRNGLKQIPAELLPNKPPRYECRNIESPSELGISDGTAGTNASRGAPASTASTTSRTQADTKDISYCRRTLVVRQGGPRAYNVKQTCEPALASSTLVGPCVHCTTKVLRSAEKKSGNIITGNSKSVKFWFDAFESRPAARWRQPQQGRG
jgi:hypothetical protein